MNKLEKLINKVNEVIDDKNLNWEQKNHEIFFEGLKSEIIYEMEKQGVIKDASEYDKLSKDSSNETECLDFMSWIKEKV